MSTKNKKAKKTITFAFDLTNPDEARAYRILDSLRPGLLSEKIKPALMKVIREKAKEFSEVGGSSDTQTMATS